MNRTRNRRRGRLTLGTLIVVAAVLAGAAVRFRAVAHGISGAWSSHPGRVIPG